MSGGREGKGGNRSTWLSGVTEVKGSLPRRQRHDQGDQAEQEDDHPYALLDALGDGIDELLDDPDRQVDHAGEDDDSDQEPEDGDGDRSKRHWNLLQGSSTRHPLGGSHTSMSLWAPT